MPEYFKANGPKASFSSATGLRRAQRAALFALAARVLAKESVSQAILPTGTGKTGIIAALPFMLSSRRILVVVPSNIIRRQIVREFSTLETLIGLRVLQEDTPRPRVKTLRSGIRNEAEWNDLEGYDVVIATPNCVSSGYRHILPPPAGLFDLLIIDEAHHAAAPTWNQVIDDLVGTPAVLLTATPFRRDKRRLPGEIAYSYPLREAIADGVYSPIDFVPVIPVAAEPKDVTLARAATQRLRLPRHILSGSQIVVRTDRVDDALRLRQIYQSAGLDLPVLTGELGDRGFDAIVNDLDNGRAPGVIVVGILTEGFNLRRLKIAVYHKKHKSLAATLQFVGRLARTGDDLLVQAELLAIPDDLGAETAALYEEDASWPDLLPEIADAAVAEERRVRDYLRTFNGKPTEFSIIAVEPRLRVQVFELDAVTPNLSLRLDEIVFSPVVEYFVDEDRRLGAIVTREIVRPDWLRTSALDTVAFDLHVLCVDDNEQFLFVQTSSDASTADIIRKHGLGDLSKVSPGKINAALHTYAISDYSMIGLRNKSPNAATGFSYKTVAGFSASKGVTLADQTTSSAGHLSGRFMDGGSTRSVGSSLDGAKFWESNRGSLFDFKEWCNALAGRLNSPQTFDSPPSLHVSVREKLSSYPQERILATVISPELLGANILVAEQKYSFADCALICRSIGTKVVVGVTHDARLIATVAIDTRGVAVDGKHLARVDGDGNETTLAEAFNAFPPTIFFASGLSAFEGTIAPVPSRLSMIDAKSLEKWNWQTVDIRSESRAPGPGFAYNIRDYAIREFEGRSTSSVILLDDGANEVADIIVLQALGGHMVSIEFVHCKWSSEDRPGHRVKDLEQLLSQVCRSVRWAFPRLLCNRIRARVAERPERLRRGTSTALSDILELIESGSAHLTFAQYAVQPGTMIDGFLEFRNGAALATICANWCEGFNSDFVLCGY